MSMSRIVLAVGTLPPAALEGLKRDFSLVRIDALDQIATLDPSVRQVIRGVASSAMTGANEPAMALLPALEIISLFGVGLDAVDLAAAQRRSIVVANTPDILTDDTADYAIALVFALARRIVQGDQFVRRGEWGHRVFPNGVRIRGRKLGIVGMGRIGAAVAARAKGLSMEVHWTGPRAKPELPFTYHDSISGLARTVDFLVLTCPGGPKTEGLVDRSVLEALGSEGFLINIARGSVVDQAAVVEALVTGKIAGAALDVFRNEPEVPQALLALENVILEPHIASMTVETRADIGNLMIRNLADHFAGRPLIGRVV